MPEFDPFASSVARRAELAGQNTQSTDLINKLGLGNIERQAGINAAISKANVDKHAALTAVLAKIEEAKALDKAKLGQIGLQNTGNANVAQINRQSGNEKTVLGHGLNPNSPTLNIDLQRLFRSNMFDKDSSSFSRLGDSLGLFPKVPDGTSASVAVSPNTPTQQLVPGNIRRSRAGAPTTTIITGQENSTNIEDVIGPDGQPIGGFSLRKRGRRDTGSRSNRSSTPNRGNQMLSPQNLAVSPIGQRLPANADISQGAEIIDRPNSIIVIYKDTAGGERTMTIPKN